METKEIALRLRKKIAQLFASTRKFQQAVEAAAPAATGVSYASVYAYVEGKSKAPPPLPFLIAAANVLNVRPAWLAFGDGEEGLAQGPVRDAIRAVVQEGSEFLSTSTGGVSGELTVQLIRRLIDAQPVDSPGLSADDIATVTRAIQVNLTVTQMALSKGGVTGPGTRSGQFLLLSLTAMLGLVPEARMGRPLREVLEKLPQRGPRKRLELPKPKAAKKKTPKKGAR